MRHLIMMLYHYTTTEGVSEYIKIVKKMCTEFQLNNLEYDLEAFSVSIIT